MLLNYLRKKLLKNTLNFSLKPPQLFLLNQTHFFGTQIIKKQENPTTHLFESYGFSKTQISNLIRNRPILLATCTHKTLIPKLDFFKSKGCSPNDIEKLLIVDPRILRVSLDNQIRPSYEFLMSVVGDNESVISAAKRSSRVLTYELKKYVEPNIAVLRECGVPDDRIRTLLMTKPRVFMQNRGRFVSLVEKIKGLGFEPGKGNFVLMMRVLVSIGESTIKRKSDIYKNWGWSDDEILSAFKRQPQFVVTSEEKIERVMDFLITKMGWDSSSVAAYPGVVLHSLEKWTIPRCLVVKFLLSKGAIDKDITLGAFIPRPEKSFVGKFVVQYSAEFPEVLNLYRKPMGDTRELQVS